MNIPPIKKRLSDQDISLIAASRDGDIKAVHKAILRGLDINDQDANGETALLYAAMSGHLDIVKLLLRYNADKTIQNADGYDPYNVAMLYGDFKGSTMKPFDEIMEALK